MAPKRKRDLAPTTDDAPTAVQQPSSRDASEEDIQDPILDEVVEHKHKQEAKATTTKRKGSISIPEAEAGDDAPASRTRSGRHSRNASTAETAAVTAAGYLAKAPLHIENGEDEHVRMEEPPKAGLVDPMGGYHTNPPPKGRQCRVYADGVFDLFHLGLVARAFIAP